MELTSKVTLFGGQGCNSLFSPRAAQRAENNLKSSPLAGTLLSRCHAAYLNEHLLIETEQDLADLEVLSPQKDQQAFLNPPTSLHNHPVVQGITLCVHQLLEHLACAGPSIQEVSGKWPQNTDEIVGFCSGILPAIVGASSRTLEEYLIASVQAVRVAFHIGRRVAESSRRLLGKGWREQGPWAMAAIRRNIDIEELREHVEAFNKTLHAPALFVYISSINGPSSVTIAGPSPSLLRFREDNSKSYAFEPVPIQGLYHGGENSLPLLSQVLSDCRNYDVSLPGYAALQVPLRLATTGTILLEKDLDGQEKESFLDLALRHILVDPLDWNRCWSSITRNSTFSDSSVDVHVMGPVSRSLLPVPKHEEGGSGRAIRIISGREQISTESNKTEASTNQDRIAVVGMSLTFPIGDEKDAFWGSLRDGKDAMQEISKARPELATYLVKESQIPPQYGNFVEKPWRFDHKFFNLSPREAKSMDPQHAIQALEDAGYSPDSTPSFQRSSMGCYVGVATGDYVDHLRHDADVYYSTGCGIFVLKRLSDAVAENDRIYGVIRGIEMNQCGNAHSITHPHQETQQALFRQVLERSSIPASSIGVVEAHGTGTKAGDAAEISSLRAVFGAVAGNRPPMHIMSVKSNTGHAEAAAGAAGLAKLLLMLREKSIPPQVNLQHLNPALADMDRYNFAITTELQPWHIIPGLPRRALLNNFGAAGSNAALILEEMPEVESEQVPQRSAYPFIVSARTTYACSCLCNLYVQRSEGKHCERLQDICYTATARRSRHEHQVGFTCRSVEELRVNLGEDKASVLRTDHVKRKQIVFVFSGQGAIYNGMGKELFKTSPVFRDSVLQCDQLLREFGVKSVVPMMEGSYDRQVYSEEDDIIMGQCACVVLEYSLAQLWCSWKVEPDLVMGHSLGEYAALVQVKAISLRNILRMVAARANLMTKHCALGTTGMVACNVSSNSAQQIIDAEEKLNKLVVACHNSPSDSVLSGPNDQIQLFDEHCKRQGIKGKRLDVPFGFHSKTLEPVFDQMLNLCRTVELLEPEIPLGSNLYGKMMGSGDLSAQYLADQMCQPVRFLDMLQSMPAVNAESAIFIEIGPAATTLPMIKNSLRKDSLILLPSLHPKQASWTTLTASAVALASEKAIMDWRAFFDGSGSKLIDAPQYPFEYQELYTPYSEENPTCTSNAVSHTSQPLDLCEVAMSAKSSAAFESPMLSLSRYISGHIVRGTALCPASVYYQLAIESAMLASRDVTDLFTIEDVRFDQPLTYDAAVCANDVRVSLEMRSEDSIDRNVVDSFKIISSPVADTTREQKYSSGKIVAVSAEHLAESFAGKSAMLRRQRSHLDRLKGHGCDTFTTRLLYETVFPRVVDYSKEFQTILQLTALANGSEAWGAFKLPQSAKEHQCCLPPSFTDTLFHAAGFVANCHTSSSEVCICVRVGSIRILYQGIDLQQTYSVYCSLFDSAKGEMSADAYAARPDGTVIGAIEGMVFKKMQLRAFETSLARQSSSSRTPMTSNKATGPRTARKVKNQANPLSVVTRETQHNQHKSSKRDESEVLAIIAKICETPVESIGLDSSLDDLGLDSLAQIELSEEIQQRHPGLNLDLTTIVTSGKVSDIQKHVASSLAKPEVITPPPSDGPPQAEHQFFGGNPMEKSTRFMTPPDSPTTNIKTVIHQVCGIPLFELQPDTTLESLGIDSLLSIELAQAFQNIGVAIDQSRFSADVTLEALTRQLTDGRKPNATSSTNQIQIQSNVSRSTASQSVLLQSSARSASPLFLFHDGSGTIGMYANMKNLDRQAYGCANHNLTKQNSPIDSLDAMASRYASSIASITSEEMILGDQVIEYILSSLPGPSFSIKEKHKGTLAAHFRTHKRLLAEYIPERFPSASTTRSIMLQSTDTMNTSRLCGVPYAWLEDEEARQQAIKEWEGLLDQRIDILEIPGNHFEPFLEKHVSAAQLELWILAHRDAD
ncbi:MAG: hypothetical protein Q9219_003934 [cf. Caloplaca sp. 3 TL-2023]